MIRVLVVDDSGLMRRAISEVLSSDPEITVVGVASDGQSAIEQVIALRPNVITMDVRMPIMDGLATTEHIMAYYPTPILALTASISRFDMDITFRMLEAGALDVMEKPSRTVPGGLKQATAELVRRVKLLSRVRTVTHLRGRKRLSEGQVSPIVAGSTPQRTMPVVARSLPAGGSRVAGPRTSITEPAPALIVIGASTGGPRVVQQILQELPADLPAAVLVVQHIAVGFTAGFVEWLQGSCRLPIRLATDGMMATAGSVTVAPDQYHLLISGEGQLQLSLQPALIQRPSIDITMQRAAESYGARTIGVLLTGMGRDGALGMAAIHRAGGRTLAQNGASCVFFGMPKAAIDLGVIDEIAEPEQIASRLVAAFPQRVA